MNWTKTRRLAISRDFKTVSIPGSVNAFTGKPKPLRVPICVLCFQAFPTPQLQGHHILPKSIPEFAEFELVLENVVSLCAGCHVGLVHGNNAGIDVRGAGRWHFFAPLFLSYTRERSENISVGSRLVTALSRFTANSDVPVGESLI